MTQDGPEPLASPAARLDKGGRRPWWRPRLDGLALRVALFLTIALLPLGLIAIYQTREFQRESVERASLSLLALTSQAASGVQDAVERSLAAAESLGYVSGLLDDPATCRERLSSFVAEGAPYVFAGILPAEGPVLCSTAPVAFGISNVEAWAAMVDDPRPQVMTDRLDWDGAGDVLTILVPLLGRRGYVALAQSREGLLPNLPADESLRPLHLVTFNRDGAVLTSQPEDGGDLGSLLPAGSGLAALAVDGPRFFGALDATGTRRLYTVVPLMPDLAYALAIWSTAQGAQGGLLGRAPAIFPILMWLVSLVVAFWAINRFVLRRVAGIAGVMHRFGRDRRLTPGPVGPEDAFELREIDLAFRQTAEAILQDEARMENAFHERGILLREVHHRVKNNLQLISSMISLQVRRAPDPRTRAILRRLQDRVLTLAAIYRILYRSADMTDVNAADVLRETLEQELKDRIGAVDLRLDDVVLDADKVVPLAFLAAEAVSNAALHLSGGGRVEVEFSGDEESAMLVVVNPVVAEGASPETSPKGGQEPGQGLGHYLMTAFAQQMGGAVETSTENGEYRVRVTFPTTRDLDEAA